MAGLKIGGMRKADVDYYLETYGITEKEYKDYLTMIDLEYT